jgi:hypothetical protein
MEIKIEVPDDLVADLAADGQDLSRAALEGLGIEAFRQRRIGEYQLRRLLGMESRWDLHAFLNEHKVEWYTLEDFEKDLANIRELERRRKAEPAA